MPTFPNSILFQLSGTLINVATILIGSLLGIWFGQRVPERARHTVVSGMGLFTAAIGLQMFFEHSINALIVLGSLLAGALLGEWWRIEDRLAHLGTFLEQRFARPSDTAAGHENRFVKGFLTASLLFCIGPIAIIGSIQNGLNGDYQLLAIKAVLDGFASLAFASTLGIGVIFSSLIILIYQGGISLLAAQVQTAVSTSMMTELTATGGILLLGVAISSILEIKKVRVGNFLPALVIAPLIVAVIALFKR